MVWFMVSWPWRSPNNNILSFNWRRPLVCTVTSPPWPPSSYSTVWRALSVFLHLVRDHNYTQKKRSWVLGRRICYFCLFTSLLDIFGFWTIGETKFEDVTSHHFIDETIKRNMKMGPPTTLQRPRFDPRPLRVILLPLCSDCKKLFWNEFEMHDGW